MPESTSDVQTLFRRARWSWRDAVIGICLCFALWAGVSLLSWSQFRQWSPLISFAAYLLVYTGVLVCYPVWVIRRRNCGAVCCWPGSGRLLRELVIALPTTLGLLMVVAAVGYLWKLTLGGSPPSPNPWAGLVDRLDYRTVALLAVMAVTIGPIAEEVFFRGFLYNSLRCACPVVLAVCLQAALFGLIHPYDPARMVLAGCLGLALAGIYEWRRTLVAPMFVHAVWNCISVIAMVATMSANDNAPVLGVHGTRDAQGQCVVSKVVPHTGAEKADIRPGNVVLSYNDAPVSDFPRLIELVARGRVGDAVRVEILRGKTRLGKQVILGSRGEATRGESWPAR